MPLASVRQAIQLAFKACSAFSDFQMWRLFGSQGLTDVELDTLTKLVTKDSAIDCHSELKEANDFCNTIRKKMGVTSSFVSQIQTLHKAV